MPIYIYYTVADEQGALATIDIEFPVDTPLDDLPLLLQAFSDLIEPLVYGGLQQAGFLVPVDITWPAASVNSDIQEKAEFTFTTELGNTKTLNLPTILEGYFRTGSKYIDQTDPDIAAFVTAIEDGIDLSGAGGSGTVQPCDQRGEDIVFLDKALENWGKRRDRPIYRPEEFLYSDIVTQILPDDLLAYYTLSESTGTIAHDSSGNGNNGTATGVTWGQTGIGDGTTAAGFDGINDLINIYSTAIRDALDAASAITLSWWSRVSTYDAVTRMMISFRASGNATLASYLNTTGVISLVWFDPSAKQKIFDPVGSLAWLHFSAVLDKAGGSVNFYVGGSPLGALSASFAGWTSLENFRIGVNSAANIQYWLGDIAHVAIWTAALSPAQIAALSEV